MKQSKAHWLLWVGLVVAAPLCGVQTTIWQVGTFEDFLQGTLLGVSLTMEGELRLAPETRAIFSPEETLALSLAADRNHNVYIGTGHQGKVFRLDPSHKSSLFFTAAEPEIFAMAIGPDGALYVGSSPEGKIYRIAGDGKAKIFYDPKTKYIWALAFDAQGGLFVGTGDRGQILRIDSSGKGKVFFESKQTHIMCLTLDRQGNLLAGSVPNGLVYRITPQGKAFVLYEASLPEIHDLATDAQGRIYAAAQGGPAGQGAPQLFLPPGTVSPSPTPVATVTVEAASGGLPQTPSIKEQTPPPQPPTAPSFNRPAPSTLGLSVPSVSQGRGALIEILPDYTAETVWSSNNESIFGLAVHGRDVLFSTDSNGRVFDLDPSRDGSKLTLLTETHESLATRLLLHGADLYVATSNIAKLFQLGATPGIEGSYESPVKDTKFVSHWGDLAWRGEAPAGTTLEFFSRSGNSGRPDGTWSDWSGPYRNQNGSSIQSPPARYFQWKAVLGTSGTATPILDDVTVSYLNQNLPPQIRSFSVSSAGERTGPTSSPSLGSGLLPGSSITGPSVSFPPPSSAGGLPTKAPTTLTWQADDPNGDQLVYTLFVKGADEEEWHLLKNKLRQTSYTIEANALADGRYVARLVASDEESNPVEMARRAQLVSAPFWMDNTPPRVEVLKQKTTPEGVEVQFRVEDSISPLRNAETSTDGKEWGDLLSDDGIVDSRLETFTVKLRDLAPGEHIIALRAYDSAGNAGVGKAVVRIPAGGILPR